MCVLLLWWSSSAGRKSKAWFCDYAQDSNLKTVIYMNKILIQIYLSLDEKRYSSYVKHFIITFPYDLPNLLITEINHGEFKTNDPIAKVNFAKFEVFDITNHENLFHEIFSPQSPT